MKYAAIFLTLVFLAGAACAGYLWLTCDVSAVSSGVVAREAAADPELFASLKAAHGDEITGDISGYVFYTWSVKITNSTFVDIEQTECRLSLLPGDVCQVPAADSPGIPARSEGTLTVTALTRVNTTPVREATVSWYLWGHPAFAPLTLH